MPIVLDFCLLSPAQIADAMVLGIYKHASRFVPVRVRPQQDLLLEEQLPPPEEVMGAIYAWGDPRLDVFLGILAERQIHTDCRLFSIIGDEIWSFHLIKRYGKFCVTPYNAAVAELGMVYGEWRPEREYAHYEVLTPLWEPLEARETGQLLADMTRPGTKVFGELPGGWWAMPELGERIDGRFLEGEVAHRLGGETRMLRGGQALLASPDDRKD